MLYIYWHSMESTAACLLWFNYARAPQSWHDMSVNILQIFHQKISLGQEIPKNFKVSFVHKWMNTTYLIFMEMVGHLCTGKLIQSILATTHIFSFQDPDLAISMLSTCLLEHPQVIWISALSSVLLLNKLEIIENCCSSSFLLLWNFFCCDFKLSCHF